MIAVARVVVEQCVSVAVALELVAIVVFDVLGGS